MKTIETPIQKHKVELKEWITGAEYEEIQKPITAIKVIIEATGKGVGTGKGEIDAGEAKRKSIENSIKVVVISVDGEKEDVVKKVQGMRKEDYLFTLIEIDKIVEGEDFTKPE